MEKRYKASKGDKEKAIKYIFERFDFIGAHMLFPMKDMKNGKRYFAKIRRRDLMKIVTFVEIYFPEK